MRWTKISLGLVAAAVLWAAAAVAADDAAAPVPVKKTVAAAKPAEAEKAPAAPKAEQQNPLMAAAGSGGLEDPNEPLLWGQVLKSSLPRYAWVIIALFIAALCGAAIGYHPLRIKNIGVKKEEAEVPKALILIAVAGAIICGLIAKHTAIAFALFGFGSFIRFRTQMKSAKETVVIFVCGGIGCLCGLNQFDHAIMGTAFVWGLIWVLDRRTGGNIERLTVILKGFGPECQVAVKTFKEKLESAGVEVVSSKVSLKKGNVTILMDKSVSMTTDQLEAILLSGDEVTRPKSIEWIKGE